MDELTYPLFPLSTVLFPGGPLPLRIFETRYLDMVSSCMRDEKPFGVCLIRDGFETGKAANTFEIGTFARIVDWNQLPGGLLGITALGEDRFQILSREVQSDQLIVARVSVMTSEKHETVPAEHHHLKRLLRSFVEHLGHHYDHVTMDFDNASWVGYRLAEILPIPMTRKQYFLELEDPLVRLTQIAELVAEISAQNKGSI